MLLIHEGPRSNGSLPPENPKAMQRFCASRLPSEVPRITEADYLIADALQPVD